MNVNDARIRVAGHELRSAIHFLTEAQRVMTDIRHVATEELAKSDPCSDQGKSLESIVLALGRMSDSVALSLRLHDCTETMIAFGAPPRRAGTVTYPEQQETLLCARHA